MALITFTGYPSSGKTRRAIQLKDYLDRRLADPSYNAPRQKVVILSDDLVNVDRSSYDGAVPISPFTPFCIDSKRCHRQSFRKICTRYALCGDTTTNGSGHHSNCGRPKLHQRIPLPTLLRRPGVQAPGLHCRFPCYPIRCSDD